MRPRVGNMRWFIAILLGIGIVINYLDRVNISAAEKPLIQGYHPSRVVRRKRTIHLLASPHRDV